MVRGSTDVNNMPIWTHIVTIKVSPVRTPLWQKMAELQHFGRSTDIQGTDTKIPSTPQLYVPFSQQWADIAPYCKL
jgi:hypothetical protein